MPGRRTLASGPLVVAVSICASMGAACTGGRLTSQRIEIPVDTSTPGRESAEPAPSILSAHHALSGVPTLGGEEGIMIVFSVDVDPASLQPQMFWVSLESGERVRAREAFLSPANENDENRTVMVVGAFGAPQEKRPVSIAIYGNLFAEDGRPLRGLAADVAAFADSGRVAAAERVTPTAGRCEGASAAVRSYWSDALRDVTAEDLARVRVRLADGRVVSPSSFDDHVAGDEAGEDNVLDLCLTELPRPVHLQVEAGAFRDPVGHPSAAVDVEIDDARAGDAPARHSSS